jgi:hypothetical protein
MGPPAERVTAVEGIPHTWQQRLPRNGVIPRRAATALLDLLEVAELLEAAAGTDPARQDPAGGWEVS